MMFNEGDINIGSKNIRKFTPRYSLVNNIVKEFCIKKLYKKKLKIKEAHKKEKII